MKLHILTGDGKRAEDVTGEMADRIKELIYEYAETHRLPLASALGVLAIVQMEIVQEQQT